MPSSAVSSRLYLRPFIRASAALVLVLFTSIGTANSPDDFRPTPEERLVEAGIDVSIPSLTTTLQDPSAAPQLRYLSAVALGRTKRIVILETLHSALTDATEEVRAGSVSGLRYLASPASAALLRKVALEDPSASVREATIGALEQIGGE
ncbi:MAG: HEAT repeat domain-containing protein, partial [Steroidobacteraceae bacterium]